MATNQSNLSPRKIALIGLALAVIVIGVLIRFEQIAVLYVLATIFLVGLLLVVAFADLEHVGREGAESSLQ